VALGWQLFSAAAAGQQASVEILDVSRGLERGNRPVTEISRADCLGNDTVKLALDLKNFSEFNLEVWAGAGCEGFANRQPGTGACWLAHLSAPEQSVYTVEVPVRDLLFGRTRAGLGDDTSDEAACEATYFGSPQILSVYPLLIDSQGMTAASASWRSTYRLQGSAPPDVVVAANANGKLNVDFAYEDTPADVNIEGFQFFCEAPETTVDAGKPAEQCSEPLQLIEGALGASLQHLRCGSAPKEATSGLTQELDGGVPYNVAVATLDTYGNVSAISKVACGIPEARVEDESSDACSFAGTGAPRSGAAGVALVALGAALARRRWRVRG